MDSKRVLGLTFSLALGVLLFAGCNGDGVSVDRDLGSNIDSVSYGVGYLNGEGMAGQGMDDINPEAFMAGMLDGLDGEESPLSEQQLQTLLMEYQMRAQQRVREQREEEGLSNQQEGEEFLAENREKEGVTETESGLQYEVIEEGSGLSPDATDSVRVHYRGTLLDGTEFESSHDGDPVKFRLNKVIPGWTEGLQLMQEGATYKFYIPGNLAYGQNPRPTAPFGPMATLIFEVELLEVIPVEEE